MKRSNYLILILLLILASCAGETHDETTATPPDATEKSGDSFDTFRSAFSPLDLPATLTGYERDFSESDKIAVFGKPMDKECGFSFPVGEARISDQFVTLVSKPACTEMEDPVMLATYTLVGKKISEVQIAGSAPGEEWSGVIEADGAITVTIEYDYEDVETGESTRNETVTETFQILDSGEIDKTGSTTTQR